MDWRGKAPALHRHLHVHLAERSHPRRPHQHDQPANRRLQSPREGMLPTGRRGKREAGSMMVKVYRSERGVPNVAGPATLAEAAQQGLSVKACVARLKRSHYAFVRLHEIFTARITAEPIYELKTGFSLHAYLCAEHVQALRTRIGEMREPPLGLEEVPHEGLQVFFDEILAAPPTEDR